MSSTPTKPIWTDLGTSDIEAATRFYGQVFGWEAETDPVMGYTTFRKDGKRVAGAMQIEQEDQPVAWSTYIGTDDADAVSKRVEAAGGTVIMAPMDVAPHGRMAFYGDPAGAVFGVWQPAEHRGFELAESEGAYCWTELTTTDPAGARTFYRDVFGWTAHEHAQPDGTYVEFKAADTSVAGLMDQQGGPAAPPHWLVHFAARDVDGTAARATAVGASVIVPGTDFPGGRFAILADPQGGAFAVVHMDQPPA
ncbi:hydroxylase [Pilimelia terevasa]|uniref:Hydroxylase n=1 Tax=Pilimelia terevasa TaxID=53372 RepID=A0A8J3BKR2_9ACTN|nr:VOC family protein [Pilimelia terevasa]GGK21520.1 hydroxylase [Pilimelia terevasa]